jgi:GR25 family glycosyltransferase involved in LPS biosynthesis
MMLDIYVINLEERVDRWQHIVKTFGNDFNLIRVDAIKHNEGWKGCFLSHKKCLQIAKEKKLQNIIVMEDDCDKLNNNFVDRLYKIKEYLNNNDKWYIFLGGTFCTTKKNIIKKINYEHDNLFEINYGFCTQLVIYNNKSYDKIIDYEINEPIDNIWPKLFNSLISIPFLTTQVLSYSNINTDKISSFTQKINSTNKRLTKLLESKLLEF